MIETRSKVYITQVTLSLTDVERALFIKDIYGTQNSPMHVSAASHHYSMLNNAVKLNNQNSDHKH